MLSKIAANRLMLNSRIRYRLVPSSKNTETRDADKIDARARLRTRSAPHMDREMKRRVYSWRVDGSIDRHSKTGQQMQPMINPREFGLPHTSKETNNRRL